MGSACAAAPRVHAGAPGAARPGAELVPPRRRYRPTRADAERFCARRWGAIRDEEKKRLLEHASKRISERHAEQQLGETIKSPRVMVEVLRKLTRRPIGPETNPVDKAISLFQRSRTRRLERKASDGSKNALRRITSRRSVGGAGARSLPQTPV
eukprot:TRINITY_DN15028_c0_g1_i1.p1 TRINITY_DN15028_c0_g1~~TRINITY_DN15028_c0_g1_i1.p1  ORF type:complete len:180 (+),score=32.54 TRINITY_DN15028_c0_g1_i1:79-540(+)